MLTVIWIAGVIVGFFALAYINAAGWLWAAALAAALAIAWGAQLLAACLSWWPRGCCSSCSRFRSTMPPLRRAPDQRRRARRVPQDPAADDADRTRGHRGRHVGWDGELFSGRPDWSKLLALPPPQLTAEEQAFLDHECEEACAMVSDWETTHIYRDLPPAGLAVHQGQGLPGHDHPQAIRRAGILGLCALAGRGQARVALQRAGRSR